MFFLGKAGAALLVHVIERQLLTLLTSAVLPVLEIPVRQREAVVTGELPRDHHQLVLVEGQMDCFLILGIDT